MWVLAGKARRVVAIQFPQARFQAAHQSVGCLTQRFRTESPAWITGIGSSVPRVVESMEMLTGANRKLGERVEKVVLVLSKSQEQT